MPPTTDLLDPLGISRSFLALAQSWWRDPANHSQQLARMTARINASLLDEMCRAWQVESNRARPDAKEGPEAMDAWLLETAKRNHRILRETHKAWSEWIEGCLKDAPEVDQAHLERCRFWSERVASALEPSNFFWANAGAVKRYIDTRGESLRHGQENWLNDQMQSNGMVATVDRSGHQVGADLAATPGVVIHRNRLMELIQYAPTTETVFRTPIVFIQPWINKYYILDLSRGRSMIEWLRDRGFTVFSVSWKNPDASMRELGFDEYVLRGALEAIETARDIAGVEAVHAVGFCIGGTALTTLMGWLSTPSSQAGQAKPLSPIDHWTLLTTLVDFSNPGDLRVFTSEGSIEFAEALMERDGFLDGRVTELIFRLLRSESLIWPFVVRSYLYGDAPAHSDVLFWNSDSTRLAKRMLSFYLRELYVNNRLVSDEGLSLGGRAVRLGNIAQPVYAVACIQDHIAPWLQVFKICDYLRGPVRFTLSSEGHVAGIVNPPSAKSRRRYWTGEAASGTVAEDWLAAREPVQGSWWEDWAEWLAPRCGPRVSPPPLGSPAHPVLCPAPGTYVFER